MRHASRNTAPDGIRSRVPSAGNRSEGPLFLAVMTRVKTEPHHDDHLANAKMVVANTLVWDNHGCMPVGAPFRTDFLPQRRRYRQAGADVVSLNVGFGEMEVADHSQILGAMRRFVSVQDD